MTNRVLFGLRNDEYGLFVSKPGINVLTASDQNMLFDSTNRLGQIVQMGTLLFSASSAAQTRTVTFGSLGYTPIFEMTSYVYSGSLENRPNIYIKYPSATSFAITAYKQGNAYSTLRIGYILYGVPK